MDQALQEFNANGQVLIYDIIRFARQALNKVRTELGFKTPLQEDIENSIVNLTVLVFLEGWLENDQNATQTLHSFCYYPYTLKSELKDIKGSIPAKEDEAAIKALRKAESIYKSMSELRTWQAEKEGIKEPAIADMTSKGRFYNFIALRFIELCTTSPERNQQLEIFNLFARRKELMMLTTKSKDKKHYDFLKAAYLDYYDIFREINEIGKTGEDDEERNEESNEEYSDEEAEKAIKEAGKKARKYVVATMQIHKFEMAYRFHLIALLAKWTVDHQIDGTELNDFLAHMFVLYARYACPAVSGDQNFKEIIDLPWDILFYDAAIPLLSGEEKGYSNDSPEYFIGYRHLVAASIAGLNHMLPLKEMPSWTDFTFIEAYSFIHNAYPIAEKISEYNPSQLDDEKYYRRIVEIYQYINSDEIQKDSVLPLSEFRKAMKEFTSRKKKPRASET